MKSLMKRRDQPAIRDTLIWAGLHVALQGRASSSGQLVGAVAVLVALWCDLTALPAIRAGTNAGMARRSRRAG